MSSILHTEEASTRTADRRVHTRARIRSLAHLDLGSTNRGVILDLSEGGLALASDAKLVADKILRMRFELPTLRERIEARGRVVWLNESKKVAGIKFERLPDHALQRIRKWISTQQWANRESRENSAQDRSTQEAISVPDAEEPRQGVSVASHWFIPPANPESTKPQPSNAGVPRPLQARTEMTNCTGDDERVVHNAAEVSTLPSGKRTNRRVQPRQRVRPLAAYVDLGPANWGMVLNLSEGGLALTASATLLGDQLLRLRFELPNVHDWIEARGRIIWLSESKKEAGIKFEELSAGSLAKIKSWLSTQAENDSRREGPTQELQWLAALHPSREPSASAVPIPLAASEERESILERSRRAKGSQTSEPKGSRFAAIVALVALISLGMGILIDRRLSQGSPRTAEGRVAEGVQQGHDTKAPLTAPAPEKASSADTQAYNQADLGSVAASSERSRSSSTSNLRPLESEDASDQGTHPAPIGRQDEHGASAANIREKQGSLAYKQSHASPAREAIPEPNKSTPATLPSMTLARPTKSPETTSAGREAVPPQINDTTPRGGNALASAVPVVNANPSKSVPRSTDVTANAASAAPPVTITMPPFPSIRVPPQLRSESSRPGTSLQMGQLASRVEVVYPPEAIRQRIEGTVKLHAIIGRDGAVESVTATTGPLLLREAATSAVRQWRYKSTVLGGQAIEAEEDLVVVFRLPARPSGSN